MHELPNCPKCNSTKVVEILYGYPVPPQNEKEHEKWEKEVVLGGCCIDDDAPKWACKDCEHWFGKIDMSDFGSENEDK